MGHRGQMEIYRNFYKGMRSVYSVCQLESKMSCICKHWKLKTEPCGTFTCSGTFYCIVCLSRVGS
jgi:hypothetical protein